MAKIPLTEDEKFLSAVKEQLLSLRKRIRHETLQKLELLKKLKEMTESRESKTVKIDVEVQCDLFTSSQMPDSSDGTPLV